MDRIYRNIADLLSVKERMTASSIILCIGNCGAAQARLLQEQTGAVVTVVCSNQEQIELLAREGIRIKLISDYSARTVVSFFETIAASACVTAVTVVEVLEFVENASSFLSVVQAFTRSRQIPAVICVQNHIRYDVASELAFSDIDRIQANATPNLYDESKFCRQLEAEGLRQDLKKDLFLKRENLPQEIRNSNIARFFSGMVSSRTWKTEYFIRRVIAQDEGHSEPTVHPFLSIVTRTTGNRPQELKEVLLCLSAQTCQDFEVLIMGHNLKSSVESSLKEVLDNVPFWIRDKIRFIPVHGGNRSTPLNVGFADAFGDYITILDDDDLVFSNWVQTFKNLAQTSAGKILKSVTVRQEFNRVETAYSVPTSAAVSGFLKDYPEKVDFLQLLHHNLCPGLCLAFPVAVFKKFGYRFDEKLNTTEDWDFILRAYTICGMETSADVTNIYRWWRKGNNSATEYQQKEWADNYNRVMTKMDRSYLLMPPESVKRIVFLINYYNHHSSEDFNAVSAPYGNLTLEEKQEMARSLLRSRSWRLTSFLRTLKSFFGKKTVIPEINSLSDEQLTILIQNITQSKCWRYTAWLRSLKLASQKTKT